MPVASMLKKERAADAALLQSGMSAHSPGAGRSGYVPICLDEVSPETLRGLPLFLMTGSKEQHKFMLYTAESARFTDTHRDRLKSAGVRFIYLPLEHEKKFRAQLEEDLVSLAANPAVATRKKSTLVYETSIELINEVLTEEGIGKALPRLGQVSRAVSTLVVKDDKAFSHLYATAQHDFYTATHMVNVGTWMTALAFAVGITDEAELGRICTAGMLHDVGKMYVTEKVLNKPGLLSDDEWGMLRDHPRRGVDHLKKQGVTDELVLNVTLQHHERIDGTGYPQRLKGDQINRISQICAVVDSFDAMTACRPFKNKVKSIAEALHILKSEAGTKYDAGLVQAWTRLLTKASNDGLIHEPLELQPRQGKRNHERFGIDCPARVYTLKHGTWEPLALIKGKAHNLSLGGIGTLVPQPIDVATYVRILFDGKGSLSNRQFEGQVTRCRAYADGWFDVGVRLCGPGVQELASAKVMGSK